MRLNVYSVPKRKIQDVRGLSILSIDICKSQDLTFET